MVIVCHIALSTFSLPLSLSLPLHVQFNLKEETVMVMVVSTTGEGEPPDTVCKFWRGLKKKSLPSDHLSNLQYALLGET